MIYLVSGMPGSGKTYFTMRMIDKHLAAGKVVVTNVALKDDWADRIARGSFRARMSRRYRRKLIAGYERRLLITDDPGVLMTTFIEGDKEGRAVAVLDEAGSFLDARAWNRKGGGLDREGMVRWFQRHRHYGFDVYLIAQLPSTIDKNVRELYEENITLKNLRNFKIMGLRVFPRCRFVAVHRWNSTDKHILKRETYGLSKRIAGMYDTHTLANDLPREDATMILPVRQGPIPRYVGEKHTEAPEPVVMPLPPPKMPAFMQVVSTNGGSR